METLFVLIYSSLIFWFLLGTELKTLWKRQQDDHKGQSKSLYFAEKHTINILSLYFIFPLMEGHVYLFMAT